MCFTTILQIFIFLSLLYININLYLSVYLSFLFLYSCLPVFLSMLSFFYLSFFYASFCISFYLIICISFFLSDYLSVSLFVCLQFINFLSILLIFFSFGILDNSSNIFKSIEKRKGRLGEGKRGGGGLSHQNWFWWF